MGSLTKRFGALVAKSTAVQALIMHPTVLAVADHALLPSCVAYRLHYTGVMHLEPGEKQQVLHRDTSVYPFANPCPPLTVATMWAVTDFTRTNGGTRICPGSHQWANDRAPARADVIATEMPAGSVLIYLGNVVHGGGSNRSDRARTGVALHYSLGWLRQEENQYLAVTQEQARTLPEELQELLGYALGSSNFGFVDHIAPKDYLHGTRDPSRERRQPSWNERAGRRTAAVPRQPHRPGPRPPLRRRHRLKPRPRRRERAPVRWPLRCFSDSAAS